VMSRYREKRQRIGKAGSTRLVAQVVAVHRQATRSTKTVIHRRGRPAQAGEDGIHADDDWYRLPRRNDGAGCSSAGLKWPGAQIKRGMTAGATLLT
jgi:hypothetical protein